MAIRQQRVFRLDQLEAGGVLRELQRAAVAGIACSDAAQITGVPLPTQQAQWVTANCSDGTVSPGSNLYVAGAP